MKHLIAVSVAVAIAGGAWIMMSEREASSVPVRPTPAVTPPAPKPLPQETTVNVQPSPPALPAQAASVLPQETETDFAPSAAPQVFLDPAPLLWEKQLADTMAGQKEAPQKAQAIFAKLATLPPEALATASSEAIALVSNNHYVTIAYPVIVNPRTSGQVLSVLFADLAERPPQIALPTLLTIAQDDTHPFAPSALDDLQLMLKSDHGRDWAAWLSAVQKAVLAAPVGKP